MAIFSQDKYYAFPYLHFLETILWIINELEGLERKNRRTSVF